MLRTRYLFLVIVCCMAVISKAVNNGLGIASITKLPKGTGCTDGSGTSYTHQETWSTSPGSCDRNDCYHDILNIDKYIVKYRCRALDVLENPDPVNCRMTAATDSTVHVFPTCCPVLVCDSRPVEPTVTLPACRDSGVTSACVIWKQLGGCVATHHLHQYTSQYCNKTCGFCT
ncbi:uncharacterized protein LOC141900711 [Tubulanus polymorphus]|uniref:uncharacterized protein LOC141900711 n=1 Tax=Tubulanus polymorphus TaxID=672921 RepID=UPI003DA60BB4